MMNFVTMFPETKNVHLVKDVGMIPYIMYKNFKFNSTIVCYRNGEYPYLGKEVNGLKIDFIKKYTGKSILDGAIYLFKNSKKIDILHLFHFCKRTSLWILIYKIFNRKGKIYLKLDANRTIKNKNFNSVVRKFILKKCTLISVETKELYDYINKNCQVKVQLIPNGFYDSDSKAMKSIVEKQNYIITVGRIGSKEKSNEILMEAFAKVYTKIPSWNVKLIGPIDENFKSYIKYYFDKYPKLKGRVIFTGAIYDRKKLNDEYKKAKIFCLTSPQEGFPLVFLEAIKNGCYIISSDVSAAYDVMNNQQYGDIFNYGDINKLSNLLVSNCNNELRLEELDKNIQKYAYSNFDWNLICKDIYSLLNVYGGKVD